MASPETAIASPIDQIMPRTYTRIFLVWPVDDTAGAIARLSSGLMALCNQPPYLKGLLSPRPEQGNRLAIVWSAPDAAPALEEIFAPGDMPSYRDLERTNAPLHHFAKTL